jgi:hypothetical protein
MQTRVNFLTKTMSLIVLLQFAQQYLLKHQEQFPYASSKINESLSVNFFWAIYSQIAPKMMRWHQLLRTKTHKKIDEKAKPTP